MPLFDGAIVLELSNTKGSLNKHKASIIMRPLATFALHETMLEYGIPSTVINYVDYWNDIELLEYIDTWCAKHGVRRPVVLCSTLFNNKLLHNGTVACKVVSKLKSNYDATVVVGGPNNNFVFQDIIPNAMFLGRSLHLFKQWLSGDEVEGKVSNDYGTTVYRPLQDSVIVEEPIVSDLYDDYCLQPTDVVQFETRLGCKFNCSFCAFEFRNAKTTNNAGTEALLHFFQKANTYGLTHFNCVDDTLNEDQEKLTYLSDAVAQLDWQPKISAFIRFDILRAKEESQMELLDKAGVHYHFWGTETFHAEASKGIKKKMSREDSFETMHYIKETYPHWHRFATQIVGLPKEPVAHIKESVKYIYDNDLTDLQVQPLMLERIKGRAQADFTADPDKYGITITGLIGPGGKVIGLDKGGDGNLNYAWSHAECDNLDAEMLSRRLYRLALKKNKLPTDTFDKICIDALNGLEPGQHIQNYIDLKKNLLK
jgi:radical SAM superfamily enzyme YgiQ (UPF0313 family)